MPPVTTAVDATRAAIADALGQRNLILNDTQTPFRPAAGPRLASAPRAIYQAYLPEDPDKGLIAVYELPDPDQAVAAAVEQQQYLGTGPGRVQWPSGTVHVVRGFGSTVITYDWLPGSMNDPSAPKIQEALETIGIAYPVD